MATTKKTDAKETAVVKTETKPVVTAKTETVAAKKEPVAEKKEPVAKKTTAAEKKPAAKKPAAKKPRAKRVVAKTSATFEFAGKQVNVDEITKEATKAFKKSHRGVVIKTIDVYVVAEESAAFYVVNGESSEEFKIEL